MTSHKRDNLVRQAPETPGFCRVPANVAWDEDFWVDSGQLGSVHDLDGAGDSSLALLVPDGAGGYREHTPERRRLGF